MENLNEREKRILDFMRSYIKEWGYPPTVRDICAALDINSTSTVHKAISGLEQKGYIHKQAGKRRAMDIVDETKTDKTERTDVVDVPVIGRIAAGTPILAEENVEDHFPLPARYIGKGNNFMLTVHGESMIEAGIMDGDYVLVEQQSDARNGQIVAAMIDGIESEATVKAFYKEGDHIRLQPYNSKMSPIIVNDCKILGVVKGVFRYFN
jgi:repressor LexA